MYLGVESSCDESALALFCPERGSVNEWVHSQIELHAVYGGVVPGLAARAHAENLPILLQKVLELEPHLAQKTAKIAVTYGPGLAGCLALGMAQAKALALAWRKPLVGVHHLRGHTFSVFLDAKNALDTAALIAQALPQLHLIVSGGNTLLIKIHVDKTIEILAQTVDDAAGEALDKGARLLGLPYPGGPAVAQMALQGDPKKYHFPRAFPEKSVMKFSFSGLKTSLRYLLNDFQDAEKLNAALPDLCASYQEAVVDALTKKLAQNLNAGYKSVGVSGGVSNNKRLREKMDQLAHTHGIPCYLPIPRHTGDNAIMIAYAAYFDPEHTLPNVASIAPTCPL